MPTNNRHTFLKGWPQTSTPGSYRGAQRIPSAIAQHWVTENGSIALVFPDPNHIYSTVRPYWIKALPDVDAVVVVALDFDDTGPALFAYQQSTQATTEPRWPALARALGRAAPYWPSSMRRIDAIAEWRPHHPQRELAAHPGFDLGAITSLALSFEDPSDAAPQTLMNLARTWQHNAADNANNDLRLAAAAGSDHIEFPAVPMATPLARPEDVSEPIRRAAWSTIMNRTDDLAFDAVAIAMDRASADLPFRSFTDIHPNDPLLAEWSNRLAPAQRTAAFCTLGPDPDDQLLVDPATDAIAVRRQDGNIRAINPGSLPTAEPLSEVILSPIGTVWIRVKNGAVYLAPQQQHGLGWGNKGGAGSTALAALLEQLLCGSSLRAVVSPMRSEVSRGILDLVEHPWPAGTVITRHTIEAAHTNGFRPPNPD